MNDIIFSNHGMINEIIMFYKKFEISLAQSSMNILSFLLGTFDLTLVEISISTEPINLIKKHELNKH